MSDQKKTESVFLVKVGSFFFSLVATISSSLFCLVLHQNQVKSLLTGAGGYFAYSIRSKQ